MPTTLHVMNPGEPDVAGGTETPIDLFCADPNRNGAKVLATIERVVVHVTDTAPNLVFVEVTDWGPDRMVLTKITNPCTTEVNYVTEYVVDVQKSAECCLAVPPAPSPDPPTPVDTIEWSFGATNVDPYADLSTGTDTIDYTVTGESAPGAMSVLVDTTSFEEDLFFVLREAADQPNRNHYFNSDVIYGNIPDSVWRQTFVYGLYQYTITRVAATLDQNFTTTFTT